MLDPGLAPRFFITDVLLKKECLFASADFALLSGGLVNGTGFDFQGKGRLDLVLNWPGRDLSDFDRLTLQLQNRTPKTILVGLTLVHQPLPGEEERPVTSFSGGREPVYPNRLVTLKFPKECFGDTGHPKKGWSRVQQIRIHVSLEKIEARHVPVRVAFYSLFGEKRKIPSGPRLTTAGLGGVTEPGPEVSEHFKKHHLYDSAGPGSGLHIPAPHYYPLESASEIMEGRIMGQKISLPPNWRANPLGEFEWAHFLHRHHFLRPLIEAWLDSPKTDLIRAIDRIICSWIQDNPVPIESNGGAGPAWETLSAAWRLREWLWIVGLVWPAPEFRGTTKEMMLRSIWEHAVGLMHHQGHPNNWIIVESAALALAGMCFPIFCQAKAWLRMGLDRLDRESRRQFFSDGAHYELSPLYQAICIDALLEVKQVARNLREPLPETFDRPLEKAAEYLATLVRPDFTWPSINDSGSVNRDYTAILGRAGELFGRPDFTWIGSKGRKGKPTSKHFQVFPDAGLAVMRSGYSPRSHMLVFRAGPAGAAHVHEDALSLEVTAFGRPVLVDPGITSYAPGPMTDYYRSSEAHNTILIGGGGPNRAWADFSERTKPAGKNLSWKRQGPLEIVVGCCRGPWGRGRIEAVVHRSVIWVRRQYWIVWDEVHGPEDTWDLGMTEVRVSWQFAANHVDVDPESGIIKVESNENGSLLLVPLPGVLNQARSPDRFRRNTGNINILPVSFEGDKLNMDHAVGRLQPPLGWISMNEKECPAAHVDFSTKAVPPVALAWLLVPREGSNSQPIRAVREDEKQGKTSISITHPGGFSETIRIGLGDIKYRHHGPSK